MSNYIIYKIYCDDCDDVYIGSTRAFSKRKYHHKNACNNSNHKHYNIKVYQTIRENGGWDCWRMIPVEELGDVSKTQSFIKEEEWRVKLNAKLNQVRAYCTEEQKREYKKEYHKKYEETHKEERKEYKKEYRETHKEERKEYDKERYQANKDELIEYKKAHKEQKKEYDKEYREQNKEQIRERKNEKIICDCGTVVSRGNLSTHIKTQKHQNYLAN